MGSRVGRRAMGMEVQGMSRRGRSNRTVWEQTRGEGLSGEEVHDRIGWVRFSSFIDLTYKWGKNGESRSNIILMS